MLHGSLESKMRRLFPNGIGGSFLTLVPFAALGIVLPVHPLP